MPREPSQKEPEAKAKATKDKTAKTRGKAKAKPKAKAGAARKNKRKGTNAEEDEDDDNDGEDKAPVAKSSRKSLADIKQEAKEPKTFARRYRPQRDFPGARWDAMKSAFQSIILPKIDGAPGVHEDWSGPALSTLIVLNQIHIV